MTECKLCGVESPQEICVDCATSPAGKEFASKFIKTLFEHAIESAGGLDKMKQLSEEERQQFIKEFPNMLRHQYESGKFQDSIKKLFNEKEVNTLLKDASEKRAKNWMKKK